jgi:hypothetical protein
LTRADKLFVDRFLQRAEEILEVAASSGESAGDCLILFDNAGGMRMFDPVGWSVTGLIREFGAREIYKIERRNGAVRVEGWSASQQCLLQRKSNGYRLPGCFPNSYYPSPRYPSTLQAVPRLAA